MSKKNFPSQSLAVDLEKDLQDSVMGCLTQVVKLDPQFSIIKYLSPLASEQSISLSSYPYPITPQVSLEFAGSGNSTPHESFFIKMALLDEKHLKPFLKPLTSGHAFLLLEEVFHGLFDIFTTLNWDLEKILVEPKENWVICEVKLPKDSNWLETLEKTLVFGVGLESLFCARGLSIQKVKVFSQSGKENKDKSLFDAMEKLLCT